MKHIKIAVLQDLFDDITKKQVEEIQKVAKEKQSGFLDCLLFVKHLIIEKEIGYMEEK